MEGVPGVSGGLWAQGLPSVAIGKEKQPADEHEYGGEDAQRDGWADVLPDRDCGEVVLRRKVYGLVVHHRDHVPHQRHQAERPRQDIQGPCQQKYRPYVPTVLHREVDHPHGQCSDDVRCQAADHRQHDQHLSHEDLRRKEVVWDAEALTVLELGKDLTVETGPPDTHPGHTRGDDRHVFHLPQPPLVEAGRGHGEDPRQKPGDQAQELPVSRVSQVDHRAQSDV